MVRSVAALAGTALVTALTVPAAAAAPSTFLAGKVAGANRSPVLVYAWPSQSVVAHLKPGATVPLRLISSTETDAAGNYRLSTPSAASLNSSASPNGDVNLEVVALTKSGMKSYSLTRNIAGSSESAPLLGAKSTVNITPLAHSNVIRSAAADEPPARCYTKYPHTIGKTWDIVGQAYSESRYINSWFTYSSGQSSGLGIGVSETGSFGSFFASGSSTEASSASIGFPGQGGIKNTYFKSRFRLGKYKTRCEWAGGSSTEYSARTTNFSGGAAIARPSKAPSVPWGNCDRYLNHSNFHLHRTHAITWSDGFDASSLIGIDLSSQTGYSQSAELTYTIHKNKAYVCGTGGDAGGPHPYQVVAK